MHARGQEAEGTIEPDSKPLLDWVLLRFPETPRTRARQWIRAGRFSVAGEIIRKPHQLLPNPGDALEMRDRQASMLQFGSGCRLHPRVVLLHLDASLAVINKGPGLISVPAPNCELSALSILANFLAGRLRPSALGQAGQSLPPAYRKLKPLPVHRLDQHTSGALCMALNPLARERLINQLRAHTMKREYVAFVEGCPAAQKGTWRNWLQLRGDELTQRIVSPPPRGFTTSGTREAITHFQVLQTYPGRGGEIRAAKLGLTIETGLKHQIRVQAAHAGVPIIGDRTYNLNYAKGSRTAPIVPFDRQALHAERLTLEHPDQPGRLMTWSAPLPGDLLQLQARLRGLSRPRQ